MNADRQSILVEYCSKELAKQLVTVHLPRLDCESGNKSHRARVPDSRVEETVEHELEECSLSAVHNGCGHCGLLTAIFALYNL
jgi:hypothetical protein